MANLIKCKYCLKIHDRYVECDSKIKHKKNKQKDKYNDDRYKVYNDCYNTTRWKKVREEVLKKSNYMCEICKQLGILNYEDIQVHHIEKIIDNPYKMYDEDNLLVVCRKHHREVEGMNENEIIEYVNLIKCNLK